MTAEVRFKSHPHAPGFVAFVALPGAIEVRVRFTHRDVGNQWKCDDCGPHRFSTCLHEVAARRTWQARQREEIR
jgi:hypothetical protein